MADNNTTENIAYWVKPGSDTLDYLKSLPIEFYGDANNIEVFDKYVKIKGAGLNMVIPLIEAADGQKEWNEAVARGAGDVVQDLAITAGATAGAVGIFTAVNSTPPGWLLTTIAVGGLAITWYTSATNQSFGAYLEAKVVELNEIPTTEELFSNNGLIITLNQNDNWDIKATIPSVSNTHQFELEYDYLTKQAIVKTSDVVVERDSVKLITEKTQAKQIEINEVTFNITQTNNLTIVNALDDIPTVSILLTHINIQIGEQLDLGTHGLYTVKGGDTLSEIAADLNDGTTTKDLLQLNTWLIDQGRVTFDQDKVLIKTDANDLANQNHVLTGETNAKNILKDYNGGDDYLIGGSQADTMEGGSGFDTYIANNGDIIKDDDDRGKVEFNGQDLTGAKDQITDTLYKDDNNFTYEKKDGSLIVTASDNNSITIEDWGDKKEALGIELEGTDIEVSVTNNAEALEATEMMRFGIELQRKLREDEILKVDLGYYKPTYNYERIDLPDLQIRKYKYRDSYTGQWRDSHTSEASYQREIQKAQTIKDYTPNYANWVVGETELLTDQYTTKRTVSGQEFVGLGSVEFKGGEKEKTFVYEWTDNDHIGLAVQRGSFDVIPKANEEASNYSDKIKIIAKEIGHGRVIEDDERGRYDPLILDVNKDGLIATTPLENSNTYFDITGDGLRERIGWIEGEDALLAFDKNDNGQIDGISEVFGNLTENGFEELKRVIDSNHDNKIDRKDELFYRLETWHDYNQDAKVQEGELKSLHEAGVKSIDLNYVSTNIEIEGNLLSEASKYTDDLGNKELVADIQLNTDAKDTKVGLEDLPDFTIDESTRELPNIKGSGLVYDSLILYNLDEEFKALSFAYQTDFKKASSEFEAYVEQLSGYTAFVNQLQEQYSVDNFQMAQSDKQAWIVERFEATDDFTSKIEEYYHNNLNNGKIPTKALTNNTDITQKYATLSQKTDESWGQIPTLINEARYMDKVNIKYVFSKFDIFIEQYSGYTEFTNLCFSVSKREVA